MKTEWLNNREPFPAGHAKAGRIGAVIDFEDGLSEPQRVYAADEKEMNDKLLTMYGNTRNTVMQNRTPKTAPPPADPPPAATTTLTTDERMQTVADLNDPARAGEALTKLVRADTGVDLKKMGEEERARERIRILAAGVQKFIDTNPDYVGTVANQQLMRDRTFNRVGPNPTAEDWQRSYDELREMNVLESGQDPEIPPATPPGEPSAPPPIAPRGSTGVRPSQLQRVPPQVQAGPKMTRTQALDLAGTDEYERRLRQEPGFGAMIDAALLNGN
jgi:hypothetical protein